MISASKLENLTIPLLLSQRAKDSPQLDAIIDDDNTINYAALEQCSAARAAWLFSQGVNKGHRIGLLMHNSVEWAINAYAVMRLGAVLVPLSTFLRPNELQTQLATSGVRHLISSTTFRNRDFRNDIANLDRDQLPILNNIWWQQELGDQANENEQAVAQALTESVCPANDMVIIFTSGSSGSPKGVIHTHGGALRANAAGLADRCITAEERLYLPMPFFWIGGFAGGLISALNAGATLLTEANPQPAKTLQFLETHRVTLFRGWPDQAEKIARDPAYKVGRLAFLKKGSLNTLMPSEQQISPKLRANLFGMTESFGPCCSHPLDQALPIEKEGSSGRPMADISVRIIDPENGQTLGANTTGLIQLRGPNILKGICGKEREEIFTPDGWYCGGDLGYIDADGYLYFAGRQDDMLKINGVSTSPSEVIAALESIPSVSRAFVTQVSIDGKDILGAALIPSSIENFNLETVKQSCREQLSTFKVPKRWKVLKELDELPRLSSGKIDKKAFRSMLESE